MTTIVQDDEQLITTEWLDTLDGSWNGDVWQSLPSALKVDILWGKNSRLLLVGSTTYICRIKEYPTKGDLRQLALIMNIPLIKYTIESPEVQHIIRRIQLACKATVKEVGSDIILSKDGKQIGGFSLKGLISAMRLGTEATNCFISHVIETIPTL